MIKLLTGISQWDALWEWARAESVSARHSRYYGSCPGNIKDALKRDDRESLTEGDFRKLKETVFSFRPFHENLFDSVRAWCNGQICPEAVLKLRTISYLPYLEICPSLQLDDFSRALDAGKVPLGEESWVGAYNDLKKTFIPETMQGKPILAELAIGSGQFTVLEGFTRLLVIASKQLSGVSLPIIPVVLGSLKEG